MMGGSPTEWTSELIELLRDLPARQMAKKYGVSKSAALRKRKKLGIPIPPRTDQIRWTPDMIALLGTMSDAALSRKLGISVDAVWTMRRARKIPVYVGRWTPENIALLGKMRDTDVGKAAGHVIYGRQVETNCDGDSDVCSARAVRLD